MRKNGYDAHRIESGLTERGIPDIFWNGHRTCGWLELKVVRESWDGTNTIGFRPGQQAWAYKANKKTPGLCKTLIAFRDCFIVLPMDCIYSRGDKIMSFNKAPTLLDALRYV